MQCAMQGKLRHAVKGRLCATGKAGVEVGEMSEVRLKR